MPSASAAFCSTRSTASFCSRLSRCTISKISSTSMGASPSEGSSSRMTRGVGISAGPLRSICRPPRERKQGGQYTQPRLEPVEILIDALDAGGHELAVRLGVGARDQVLLGGQVLEDPAPLEDLHHTALDDLEGRQAVDPLAGQLDGAL